MINERLAITTRLRNPDEREAALRELTNSKLRDAASIAAGYLDDEDKFVRLYGLECLLRRGSRRYADRATAALRDSYDMVRVTAIQCLVAWRCRNRSSALRRLLRDRSPMVRAYAAWGLGSFRDRKSVPEIELGLSRERRDISKAGMLEALYLLTKRREFAHRLVGVLHDSGDHQARSFAANSLLGISDEYTRELAVAALERAVRAEPAKGVREVIRANLRELGAQG
jgi:HEAT repeat protein